MGKELTKEDKANLSKKFDISIPLIDTVLEVESSGSGFQNGRIKIQFEPYWFKHYTGHRIANGVETQSKEWEAYNYAKTLDAHSAMLSTSWGLGQIMGFNFKKAGYPDVESMVESFIESEYEQLYGMLSFIKFNRAMYNALKMQIWHVFAYHYNGELYKKFNYDEKLEAAYERHKK